MVEYYGLINVEQNTKGRYSYEKIIKMDGS